MLLVSFRPTFGAHSTLDEHHWWDGVTTPRARRERNNRLTCRRIPDETCGQPVTVSHLEYTSHAWRRSKDLPGNGQVSFLCVTASRRELDNGETNQVTHLFHNLSKGTAGPFLSDRECSPLLSPADGMDGILNMKPAKANSWCERGWSYVEVVDIRVVKVVVEGEERRRCPANTGPPFIRPLAGGG
jgi:hypothetical protein